jgi:hypothetical protein
VFDSSFFSRRVGIGITDVLGLNGFLLEDGWQPSKNKIEAIKYHLFFPFKIVFAVNKFRFLRILIGIIKT